MPTNKPKLLYIAGWCRSGSTILDQILGQLEGFFSVGELANIWNRGPEALCGCGRPLKDCETWRRIFIEAFGVKPDGFDFDEARSRRSSLTRFRYLWLLTNPLLGPLLRRSLEPHLELTRTLYRAVGSIASARVIVDSSKSPSHAHLLELAGVGVPYIVHLVRDPRGCAYSYQVRKPDPDSPTGQMTTVPPVVSSLKWVGTNLASTALWGRSPGRYMLLRYEDFMAAPEDTVLRILKFVGEPVSQSPFLSENSLNLKLLHSVSGNPSRFATGVVQLKIDNRWKSQMKGRYKLLVTALTAPLLPSYGYSARWNATVRSRAEAACHHSQETQNAKQGYDRRVANGR